VGRAGIPICCVLAGGCRFDLPSTDEPARDASGADTQLDAPAGGCLARWRDGTVMLGDPAQLAALGSSASDRDPYVSPDELTIYFSSDRNGAQGTDVYAATRASIAASFAAPQRRSDLSSALTDSRFSTTSDELVGVVASDRTGTEGSTDLWIATRANRASPFGSFSQTGMANINTAGGELDPELAADGLRVYLAIGSPQRIAVSARSGPAGTFGIPQPLGELLSNAGDADPSLSSDELVLLFTSRRPGGAGIGDLWYATRASSAAPFGAPVRVPSVNTIADDGDPSLSADGCRLYFASLRTGDWELFVAEVTP
jgi:Tol biopolymer transport system component